MRPGTGLATAGGVFAGRASAGGAGSGRAADRGATGCAGTGSTARVDVVRFASRRATPAHNAVDAMATATRAPVIFQVLALALARRSISNVRGEA